MEEKIAQLESRIAQLEKDSVKFPIDIVFLRALNEAYIAGAFDQFNVKRLVLTPGQAINPALEGEIVFHKTTPSLKVLLGGVVKTITVS